MSHGGPRSKNPPLSHVARMPASGRGWAAKKGQYLTRAASTGASRPEFFNMATRTRIPFESRCQVEHCADRRQGDFHWCAFHVRRARKLGVTPPSD